jgi:phosphoglucosamine mutase
VTGRGALDDATEVWDAVARAQAELGCDGRVLLRPSGTEPLVRVMVEAPTDELAMEVALALYKVVESALGGR